MFPSQKGETVQISPRDMRQDYCLIMSQREEKMFELEK